MQVGDVISGHVCFAAQEEQSLNSNVFCQLERSRSRVSSRSTKQGAKEPERPFKVPVNLTV